jgi:hypothetical protein
MVILSYCYDRKCEVIRSWLEEDLGLSPEDKARKCEVIRALEISILQEEISWRQSLGFIGLKRGINALNFFSGLLIRTGGQMLWSLSQSIDLILPISRL